MPIHDKAAVSHGNAWVQTFKQPIPWLWDGLVAENAITLLSAPEKTGKTTVLSLLLDRRREGGQLLGRPVRPGRTILCSEENCSLWSLRQPPLDFGPQLEYHQPIGDPSPRRWRRFINHLLELADDSFDLLVIDTVMSFLPAAQNNPSALRKALNELRVVCGRPAGVLLLHQTCAARNRSRARGPLTAFADILIDMQIPPGDRFTRRRHFYGVGRYPGTVQHVAAELNPEGDRLSAADGRRAGGSAFPGPRYATAAVGPKPRAPDTPGNSRSLARGRAAARRLVVALPDARLRAGHPRPHRGGKQGGGVSLWAGPAPAGRLTPADLAMGLTWC